MTPNDSPTSPLAVPPLADAPAPADRAALLTCLSHELGQPLTILWGCLEMALEKSRQGADCCQELQEALAECEALSMHLRALGELAEAELPCEPWEATLLGALVKELAEEIAPLAETRGVRFSMECEANPAVRGNAQRLRQAVLHVLGAAIQAGGKGACVRLCVSDLGTEDGVTIATSAPPHSLEEWERLLDPFSPRDAGSVKLFRHGLGLAVARRTCQSFGGGVEPVSVPGCPWGVRLRLPLVPG